MAAAKLGGKCVLASEIDPRLREVYTRNFGFEPKADIKDIDPSSVPDHELLCAGFPCQPFSKAGSQSGWEDTIRGTLFWNIIEILKIRRPRLVLLENVAHFVRHDSGSTYQKVRNALEKLGYTVDYKQFSPHQFGVPQIRERIYMIGSQNSLVDFNWPSAENCASSLSLHSVLDKNPHDAVTLSEQVVRCIEVWQEFLGLFSPETKLPSFPIWSMEFGATYPYAHDSLSREPLSLLRKTHGSFGCSLQRLPRSKIYKLVPSHARGARGVFPAWKKLFIRQNREFFAEHRRVIEQWLPKIQTFPTSFQKFEWNCQGEERNIWQYVLQFRASGLRVKRATTSPSLVAMTTTQTPIIAWEKRYMTFRECARLQSMDNLTCLPSVAVATAAFGNAVNVTVVESILSRLLASQKILPISNSLTHQVNITDEARTLMEASIS
jgi:DNA (cytosine-5)-methyltransferase 1